MVATCKDPWIVSISSHHDNPYDGATLITSLTKAEEHSQVKIDFAFAEKAYRGKATHPDTVKIFISDTK